MSNATVWPQSPDVDAILMPSDQVRLDGSRPSCAVAVVRVQGRTWRAVVEHDGGDEAAIRQASREVIAGYRRWVLQERLGLSEESPARSVVEAWGTSAAPADESDR
jgi:hypothetical protein